MIRSYPALDILPGELTAEEIAYVPQPGDYVYFRWKNAAKTVNVSHVGIVASVDDEEVSTWEGNAGRKVAQRTYPLDSREIVGYGRPVYDTPK